MECPGCTFQNPQGMKFCGECGIKLEVACPKCNFINPPKFKFCGECGENLRNLPDSTSSDINKTENENENRERENQCYESIEGERKHVTILFSDISNYTAMSERLDPEAIKEITSHVFGKISKIIIKYDGFIEKYIGDAVMAVFGASKSCGDEPVMAIRAAGEIHKIVKKISPEYEDQIKEPLRMHTGINSGLVVTGDINFEKGTHGIAGDTINLAARLCSLGKEDEIIVDPDTFGQAEGFYNFEKKGPVKVKGKTKPVTFYKVISLKDQPRKIHRLHGVRTTMIGRTAELSHLNQALERLEKGRGSVISIIGTAGTGKSRLIEEFKATLDTKKVQWREGHAYPYTQGIPYAPLIDLLNRAFKIEEGISNEALKEKVRTGITNLSEDLHDIVPYIGSLYSLNYPEIEEVNPELWRSNLQKAIFSIISALANRGQTIICLEDLHWVDQSFMDLLRILLPKLKKPVIFLCVYRPAITLFSGSHLDTTSIPEFYHELRIKDLSPSESQIMVEALLDTNEIPRALERFIQNKVEGNPFYLEEMINSLIETKILVKDNDKWMLVRDITEADISSTIHGVISSRLDRLDIGTKRILQEASVIGRSFFYEILKRITKINKNIDGSLSSLERLEMIKTRSVMPDIEYIFKHALTQEVVYNGLLKKERHDIHERIGLIMEKLFDSRIAEFYETLAFHFMQGHSSKKAIDYLIKSGEKCLERFSVKEANDYFQKAYNILQKLPESQDENQKALIDILNNWAFCFYYLGDFNKLLKIYSSHVDDFETLNDDAKLGMFNVWYGVAYCCAGKMKKSYELLKKAIKLGEKSNDQKVIGYACTWMSWTCGPLTFYDEGIAAGKRARKIARSFPSDQYLYFKPLAGMCWIYFWQGQLDKLFDGAKELLQYGNRTSNSRSIVMGHWLMSGFSFFSGDMESSIDSGIKSLNSADDPFYRQFAKTFVAPAYILTDKPLEAKKMVSEIWKFHETNNIGLVACWGKGVSGIVEIIEGRMNKGFETLGDAVTWAQKDGMHCFLPSFEYFFGFIYLNIVQGKGPKGLTIMAKNIGFIIKNVPVAAKKAEAHLQTAVNLATDFKQEGVLALAYFGLSQLYIIKKRGGVAREFILKAIEVFDKIGADTYLNQAKNVLAQLDH